MFMKQIYDLRTNPALVWSAQCSCSFKEHPFPLRNEGGKAGKGPGSAAERNGNRWKCEICIQAAPTSGSRSSPGCAICIKKWFPPPLLELYDSPGLIGSDKLWRGVQKYTWIDSRAAQITQTWRECVQSGRRAVYCYCSEDAPPPHTQAILMTRDQFIVRRALTNCSFFVFTWVEMSFIV